MLIDASKHPVVDQNGSVRPWGDYLALLTAIVVVVGLFAPRSMAFTYFLVAAVLLVDGRRRGMALGVAPDTRIVLLSLFAFFGYSALSALWSIAPGLAITKSAYTGLVALSSAVCASLVLQAAPADWTRLGRGLAISGLVGTAFLAFEVLTGSWLQISIVNGLGIDPSVIANRFHTWQDGVLVGIKHAWANKNLVAIVVLLAAIVAATSAFSPRRNGYVLAAIISLLAALAILGSGSETAKLALVTTTLVAALAVISGKWTARLLAITWILACTLVVPLTLAVYDASIHRSPWIAEKLKGASGRERIGILRQYAIRIEEAPFFGHGANSSYVIGPMIDKQTPLEERMKRGEWMAQHPHNAYMQVWYELGAVGVALFMVAGLVILRSVRSLNPPERPVAYATFAAFATVIAPSYGMWQYWQVGLFGLTGIALAIAIGAIRARTAS